VRITGTETRKPGRALTFLASCKTSRYTSRSPFKEKTLCTLLSRPISISNARRSLPRLKLGDMTHIRTSSNGLQPLPSSLKSILLPMQRR
jgi:hypothetical protein